MQRQNINSVVCAVVVFIVLTTVAVVIIFLRDDTSSNPTLLTDSSSSSGSVIFNNSSLLNHNTSINYPWTLSGSSNKTDDINEDEEAISYHDGPISNFISITDTARGDIDTPIKSTRSNKCIGSDKSLMRFTLLTDNYPVRTFSCLHMI